MPGDPGERDADPVADGSRPTRRSRMARATGGGRGRRRLRRTPVRAALIGRSPSPGTRVSSLRDRAGGRTQPAKERKALETSRTAAKA